MKTPFEVHAMLTGQAQAFLGGQPWNGNRGLVATLTIFGITIPCTHSPIVRDWVLDAGKSPTTIIEYCEFLASDLPSVVPNTNPQKAMSAALDKGVQCSLKVNQNLPAIGFQLWTGGLEPGGLLYRFMLVSASYRV